MFKKPLNFINHEKRNLEIHHSDDSRHPDGYSDHFGRDILHGSRLRRKQPLQTGEAVFNNSHNVRNTQRFGIDWDSFRLLPPAPRLKSRRGAKASAKQ